MTCLLQVTQSASGIRCGNETKEPTNQVRPIGPVSPAPHGLQRNSAGYIPIARRRQDATRKAYATGCQEQEAQKWQGSEGLV